MYEIIRSDAEVNDMLNLAADGIDKGSAYPGMSYEQGIQDGIDWLTGQGDPEPPLP